MKPIYAGLFAFVLALSINMRAEPPSSIAIKDAHVVTVSGSDLPKATVLLSDGLIRDVGPDISIPADAWVIDGTGLTVYPGFIDGLSTWGIPPAAPATAAGGRAGASAAATPAPAQPAQPAAPPIPETEQLSAAQALARGPESRPQTYSFERAADLVSPADNRLDAVRAAGFTTAATFPNRGIFEGLGAIIDFAGDRGRDMVVAQPVGQQIVFRVGGGGMGRSFPASLMGNISYVRQLYLDLDQYKQAKQIYSSNPSGVRRPEYDHTLEGLAESPRILLPADEAQQIDRMLNFGPELKTPFVLYGMHEAFLRIDELKRAGVPVLISLKWPEKPRDADPTEIPNMRDLEMREKAPATPEMLAKAGVKFAFFSDGLDTAPDLKKAVKKAIDSGLPRREAIRALSLTPAEIYGVSDRLGSIDKGKIANLIVTKGDMFEEKTTIEYLFIDGKQFRPSKESQQGPPSNGGPRMPRTTPTQNENSDGGIQ